MLALTLLFVFVGQMIGGTQGMITAFIFAALTNFFAYWFSDKIVLLMYGAKEVKESELPEIYTIVRNLTQKSGLPMPKIYIINTPSPNAFATGRNPTKAAVAVTKGILDLLDEKELEGVIAHELSHIKNRDTLISVIAATIAGAIYMLARIAQYALMFGGMGSDRDRDSRNSLGGIGMLLVLIVAPIAAMIIQLAISRSREYIADETASRMTGKPMELANALRKLSQTVKRIPFETNPATSHLFIVNPLKGETILTLFSTHPPITERIKRLEYLATQISGYNIPEIIY
jgi:heat shock protein HtpX